jgi:hypothetical protein
MKNILSTLALLLISIGTFAQNASTAPETVEMADVMRSNGKIYIVISVISIIFVGIIIYLISIDRKVGKLEKQFNNKK